MCCGASINEQARPTLYFAALYGPTFRGSMARCGAIDELACCPESVVLSVHRVGYGVQRALHELFELMVSASCLRRAGTGGVQ